MELEQIAELIDRVSASELDSFCLEQNGMRLSLKRNSLGSKQIRKHKALWCSSKNSHKVHKNSQNRCHRWSLQEQSPQKQSIQKR